jgi:hypothetical protein
MSYQPNFNDVRVIRRIKQAYGWTRATMSITKPTKWAQREINKYLGHQTNELGRYLREVLLITTNNHYSMTEGITKEYLLNERGLNYLYQQLTKPCNSITWPEFAHVGSENIDTQYHSTQYPSVRLPTPRQIYDQHLVEQLMTREYNDQLSTGNFTYKDQSSRLWHPIQNIKRQYKSHLLATHGYTYQYDINTCAPTLIMRREQQLGMDEWPQAIHQYINNKDLIRQELSDLTAISVHDIKVVINALFCGARLGNNPDFALYRLIGDRQKIQLLRDNPFIQQLRSDIKLCWRYIATTMSRRTITDKNNTQRLLPISSKQKWQVYFQLEREVLNSVVNYLKETNNYHFLEHDGWSTKHPIDQHRLHQHIYNQTNFILNTSQLNTLV